MNTNYKRTNVKTNLIKFMKEYIKVFGVTAILVTSIYGLLVIITNQIVTASSLTALIVLAFTTIIILGSILYGVGYVIIKRFNI